MNRFAPFKKSNSSSERKTEEFNSLLESVADSSLARSVFEVARRGGRLSIRGVCSFAQWCVLPQCRHLFSAPDFASRRKGKLNFDAVNDEARVSRGL